MIRLVELQGIGDFLPADWQWKLEFVNGHLTLAIHRGEGEAQETFFQMTYACRTVSFERAESFLRTLFGVTCYQVGLPDHIPEAENRSSREAHHNRGYRMPDRPAAERKPRARSRKKAKG